MSLPPRGGGRFFLRFSPTSSRLDHVKAKMGPGRTTTQTKREKVSNRLATHGTPQHTTVTFTARTTLRNVQVLDRDDDPNLSFDGAQLASPKIYFCYDNTKRREKVAKKIRALSHAMTDPSSILRYFKRRTEPAGSCTGVQKGYDRPRSFWILRAGQRALRRTYDNTLRSSLPEVGI